MIPRGIRAILAALSRPPTRRQFIYWTGAAATVIACRTETAPVDAAHPRDATVFVPVPRAGKVLDTDAWRAFEAATTRILPSDDGPGAREANVIEFIDRQLATPMLTPAVPVFVQGARLLDKWANARHTKPFAALAPDEQDAILEELARGAIPVKAFPQKELFALLHSLTLEGFLSDPIHGGNADQVGWRYIGFAEPPLRRPGEPHSHSLPTLR